MRVFMGNSCYWAFWLLYFQNFISLLGHPNFLTNLILHKMADYDLTIGLIFFPKKWNSTKLRYGLLFAVFMVDLLYFKNLFHY